MTSSLHPEARRQGGRQPWGSWPPARPVKVVRSELTYMLVRLDKEYTERHPDQRWEDYHAPELLRHFSHG